MTYIWLIKKDIGLVSKSENSFAGVNAVIILYAAVHSKIIIREHGSVSKLFV